MITFRTSQQPQEILQSGSSTGRAHCSPKICISPKKKKRRSPRIKFSCLLQATKHSRHFQPYLFLFYFIWCVYRWLMCACVGPYVPWHTHAGHGNTFHHWALGSKLRAPHLLNNRPAQGSHTYFSTWQLVSHPRRSSATPKALIKQEYSFIHK